MFGSTSLVRWLNLVGIVKLEPIAYSSPMHEDATTRHYTGRAGREYHEVKRGIPPIALPWVAEARAEKLARYVHPEDSVFEFGVGAGWNLAVLRCRSRLGHDISNHLEPALKELGVGFVTELEQVPGESQDIVLCHHSLEHALEPAHVLRRLKWLLAPQGKLLLFVPFEDERRHRHFSPAEPNHHLYSWNPQTLGNLVTELGFEVTEAGLGRFTRDRFSANWAVRLGAGRRGFRIIRRLAHIICPLEETRVVAVKSTETSRPEN